MTDVKDTRTLTLEGALKVLNAAIAEATRIGQPMCIAVVPPAICWRSGGWTGRKD